MANMINTIQVFDKQIYRTKSQKRDLPEDIHTPIYTYIYGCVCM